MTRKANKDCPVCNGCGVEDPAGFAMIPCPRCFPHEWAASEITRLRAEHTKAVARDLQLRAISEERARIDFDEITRLRGTIADLRQSIEIISRENDRAVGDADKWRERAEAAETHKTELLELLSNMKNDSLDAIMEVIGAPKEYNSSKLAMRDWFVTRIDRALSAKGGE
ncbi:hypothetical protein [Celeribacter ethanolicus]|uniref:hypothetical protein n=1 Tax=Celeribacter ethanolicus TaxID=1758178 RepID=UPI00082CF93C|nr:hypothetical protein [Celeribacter ethanolicus]TNE64440.1 MAG: hypothetical protein EP336_15235 [Paracoccaceae bacterium]